MQECGIPPQVLFLSYVLMCWSVMAFMLVVNLRPRANVKSKSRRLHLKQMQQRVDFIPAW